MTFYHFKISNSFRLLTLLEKLLTADDCGTEEKVLEWVNILVTGHYLQITMCKVQEMDVLRTRLQETVARIQERNKLEKCVESLRPRLLQILNIEY